MKRFENPEIELNELKIEDVITTSLGENETPTTPGMP